jgi:hypothetical protein
MDTRDKINAEFVVYGPNLSDTQIAKLKKHDMEYKSIHKDLFNSRMQSLKFQFLLESQATFTTYLDWDTFIVKDWEYDVFHTKKFNLGVTVRNEMIEDKCLRALTNGGVIFLQNVDNQQIINSINLLHCMHETIMHGKSGLFPEYDEIWKTLEIGRRPEKTHYRIDHRWWCDQVILSSLVLYYIRKYKVSKIPNYLNYEHGKAVIGMFNCSKYNCINAHPSYSDGSYYIGHLKKAGRVKTFGKDVTKERL